MKKSKIDLGPTFCLDDEALEFAALVEDAEDITTPPEPARNSAINVLNDGHDSMTFSAEDIETFGSLVTSDAVDALEKISGLSRAFLDAQANGDDILAAKILDQIHTYFTE